MKKIVNGELVDLTPEEENQFNSYSGDTEAMKMERRINEQVRVFRDQLLKDSDWTQLADKGGLADSKVTEWATYRQSLRDLPTASGWPYTHTLPTKPS